MKISLKLFYQYMAIFFNLSPTSRHLHSLQVENCGSNSRLVVDEMTMVNSSSKGLGSTSDRLSNSYRGNGETAYQPALPLPPIMLLGDAFSLPVWFGKSCTSAIHNEFDAEIKFVFGSISLPQMSNPGTTYVSFECFLHVFLFAEIYILYYSWCFFFFKFGR